MIYSSRQYYLMTNLLDFNVYLIIWHLCLLKMQNGFYINLITSMSDDFNLDDIAPIDWLNEVSAYTDKHMPTLSEVSKDHFINLYQFLDHQDPSGKPDPKGPKQTRERNKLNAKNYRQRKRSHMQAMKKQLQLLHHENAILKSQKVCRWCKRSFLPHILTEYQKEKQHHHSCYFHSKDSKDMELQFQNPHLQKSGRGSKNGKIWIALGILLLVLGISMHGLNGDKGTISRIQLQKEHVMRWRQQLQQKDKSEYFQVAMKLEQSKTSPNQSEGKEDLQINFRSPSETKSHEQQDKISISNDFLLSIQAELDDLGAYL